MNAYAIATLTLAIIGPLLAAVVLARTRGFRWDEFGTVTVSPTYPGTSAPTAATMQNYNMVIGTVVAGASSDVQTIITHNFGLSAAEIAQGFPLVVLTGLGDETTSSWWEASQNPNYTVLAKNNYATGPTTQYNISRPHSITR
jgi:hypothetical protein